MTEETRGSFWRWARLLFVVVTRTFLVLFSFLFLLMLGALLPLEAIGHLLLGWFYYTTQTLPSVSINPEAVVLGFLCLLALALGGHQSARWLFNNWASPSAEPKFWRPSWTLLTLCIFVLMFIASIASIGIVHQTLWLANGPIVDTFY